MNVVAGRRMIYNALVHSVCLALMLSCYRGVFVVGFSNAALGSFSGGVNLPAPKQQQQQCFHETTTQSLQLKSKAKDGDDYDDSLQMEDDSQLFRDVQEQQETSEATNEMMDELAWRKHKVMLEEQNERRFQKALRSKPRKLSYEQAKKWVQANLGVDTQEEFEDLVLNGNLRTPYIPKDPMRYYTDVGTWLGWDDFLNVAAKN